MSASDNLSAGQFFHGTNSRLRAGQQLGTGRYVHPETGEHVYDTYFTTDPAEARFYGRHVYRVAPTRPDRVFEDPESISAPPPVTSYYSPEPVRVVSRHR